MAEGELGGTGRQVDIYRVEVPVADQEVHLSVKIHIRRIRNQ
jgi:hypothetical protein